MIKSFSRASISTGIFAIALALAGSAYAQSASSSFHKAGEETEHVGSSAGHAIGSVFHGTFTASKDSAITGAVKTRLLADEMTKSRHIHVRTVAGVVTLRGTVSSDAIASAATRIAAGTSGVKGVRNRLKVRSTS